MSFPPNMPRTNMMQGLGGPPVSTPLPRIPGKGRVKKLGKRRPSNKANKFAKALTKAPKVIDQDMDSY